MRKTESQLSPRGNLFHISDRKSGQRPLTGIMLAGRGQRARALTIARCPDEASCSPCFFFSFFFFVRSCVCSFINSQQSYRFGFFLYFLQRITIIPLSLFLWNPMFVGGWMGVCSFRQLNPNPQKRPTSPNGNDVLECSKLITHMHTPQRCVNIRSLCRTEKRTRMHTRNE